MQSFWRDKNGKVVIAQWPNAPLKTWIVCFLASKLPIAEKFVNFFELVAFGALFTWAWMEIFDGVNLFRRLIGVIVMAFMILSRSI